MLFGVFRLDHQLPGFAVKYPLAVKRAVYRALLGNVPGAIAEVDCGK
jgi:hypothetical protein